MERLNLVNGLKIGLTDALNGVQNAAWDNLVNTISPLISSYGVMATHQHGVIESSDLQTTISSGNNTTVTVSSGFGMLNNGQVIHVPSTTIVPVNFTGFGSSDIMNIYLIPTTYTTNPVSVANNQVYNLPGLSTSNVNITQLDSWSLSFIKAPSTLTLASGILLASSTLYFDGYYHLNLNNLTDQRISNLFELSNSATNQHTQNTDVGTTSPIFTIGDSYAGANDGAKVGKVKYGATVASTGPLTYPYSYSYNSVTQTITFSNNVNIVIDNITLIVGDTILIKDETAGNAQFNGLYVCIQASDAVYFPTILKRANILNTVNDFADSCIYIYNGTINSGSMWICTIVPQSITGWPIGFSQLADLGIITAPANNLTGTVLAPNVVNSSLTSVGTLTNYGGVTLRGTGIGFCVYINNTSSAQASDLPTTVVTGAAGTYVVYVYINWNNDGSGSSSTTATIGWTDKHGSHTITTTPAVNNATTYYGNSFVVHNEVGNLTVAVTINSTGAATVYYYIQVYQIGQ